MSSAGMDQWSSSSRRAVKRYSAVPSSDIRRYWTGSAAAEPEGEAAGTAEPAGRSVSAGSGARMRSCENSASALRMRCRFAAAQRSGGQVGGGLLWGDGGVGKGSGHESAPEAVL